MLFVPKQKKTLESNFAKSEAMLILRKSFMIWINYSKFVSLMEQFFIPFFLKHLSKCISVSQESTLVTGSCFIVRDELFKDLSSRKNSKIFRLSFLFQSGVFVNASINNQRLVILLLFGETFLGRQKT